MAFLTKKPILLKHFFLMRMCTTNTLCSRKKSFCQTLPKFPYPNADALTRHQLVKARPPPIYPDAFAEPNNSTASPVPEQPKRYVEFLRDDTDAEEEPPLKLIKGKSPVGAKKAPELLPECKATSNLSDGLPTANQSSCMPEAEVAHNANANANANANTNANANGKQNRGEWENQRQQCQRRRLRDKAYFERVFKVQHENMQRIQKNVNRIKQNLDNAKILQRMNKLMQLQQKLEELEPASFNSYKPSNVRPDQSRTTRHGLKPQGELWSKTGYKPSKNPSKNSTKSNSNDTALVPVSNKPAHSDSDSGNVAATSSSAMINVSSDNAGNLDKRATAKKATGESAMYKLCKRILVNRHGNSKY